MFEKLEGIENRFEELNMRLTEPDVVNDQNLYMKLMKEHSELSEIVEKFREWKGYKNALEDARAMLNEKPDPELMEMIQQEMEDASSGMERTERELKILLMPKDPNDDKDVIVEIRAGAGGDEAALFAAVLMRMYTHYAENKGWAVNLLDSNPTEIGGFKEVVFEVEGKGAYSRLKFESGVHRVQRVPATESSGRIHTSTVTVAVLPEADELDEIEINPNDIEVDTYRASGAGGQHVNKTSSAIRITHLPTGIVVTCQDQRSQHKNREKAMRVLKAKLNDIERQKQSSEVAENRKAQVGTGDRSERIRTYNYPQRRVTDHRIGYTLYRIDEFLNGDIDEILDALITSDQAEKLSVSEE
ncbi:MAG: peptide chain release factor 1 [Clostridiaceae bacterium]|jgi:peptide chain release factor 1|nr:peptide chain release factor 1 [Bacillota bacterium]NLI38906.1 peptide chain release factor 1 [Clostridiaceae bacterium]